MIPDEKTLRQMALSAAERMFVLLSDPDRWARHWLATDAKGEPTEAGGPDATCWCLLGAKEKVLLDIPDDDTRAEVNSKLWRVMYFEANNRGQGVAGLNDNPHTTHVDVLEFLKDVADELREA